jgi:hypothetical protein
MRSALDAADVDPAQLAGPHDPFTVVDRELAAYGLGRCA